MYSHDGQAPGTAPGPAEAAIRGLANAQAWSEAQRRGAAHAAVHLVRQIPKSGFFAAGLSGAPGCGKSTLAALVRDLARSSGTETLVLSLDDYYLPRRRRLALAERHPLLTQRGVPGTHDWDQLLADFDRIKSGNCRGMRLPRFDKARDDRVSRDAFRKVMARPRVVILEGWLIGSPPQEPADLRATVNDLEAEQDADGRWRGYVNEQLGRYQSDLETRLDQRWFLAAPDWAHVVDWRWQQEQETVERAARRHLEHRHDVAAFLQQFERIARHMLTGCRDWADVVIAVGPDHVMRPA